MPTDGFYEWAKVPDGKQPYRITMKDGEPFAMAGLGEWWRRGEQRIESFTIIVTSANELCRPIHDRMPVILHSDTWEAWLTTKDADGIGAAAAVSGQPDGHVFGQQACREREER